MSWGRTGPPAACRRRRTASQGRAVMLQTSRVAFSHLPRLATSHPGFSARLRLFGLLTMVVAVFTGLQVIVQEGTPRIEVRIVPRDVPVEVIVPVFVERIVERIVYVPIPMTTAAIVPQSMQQAIQSLRSGALGSREGWS